MSTSTFFCSNSVDHDMIPWEAIKASSGVNVRDKTIEIYVFEDMDDKNVLYYDTQKAAIENLNRMIAECEKLPNETELERRVEQLEIRLDSFIKEGVEKIDALWFSPGMPGYELAKRRFKTRVVGKTKKRKFLKKVLGSSMKSCL